MFRILAIMFVGLWAGWAAAQDYLVRPGDTLDISVLEDPGLNRAVLVRPDGRISLPLAGSFEAAGRTPEALQADIRRALARDFVSPPTVTVSVTGLSAEPLDEQAVFSIYVIGAVNSQGRLDLSGEVDVLQALAQANGLTPFAATRRIQVRRGGDHLMLFNYDNVTRGAVPREQILLREGDVIVVPERGLFE